MFQGGRNNWKPEKKLSSLRKQLTFDSSQTTVKKDGQKEFTASCRGEPTNGSIDEGVNKTCPHCWHIPQVFLYLNEFYNWNNVTVECQCCLFVQAAMCTFIPTPDMHATKSVCVHMFSALWRVLRECTHATNPNFYEHTILFMVI